MDSHSQLDNTNLILNKKKLVEEFVYESQIDQWLEFIKHINKDVKHVFYTGILFEISYFVKWSTIVKYDNDPTKKWNNTLISPDNKIPWGWKSISSSKNITWDIISNNLNYPWDWNCISNNPNITWDIVKSNLTFPPRPKNYVGNWPTGIIPWCWSTLSYNSNITWDIVINNLEYPPRPDNKSNFSCDGWKNANDSNFQGDWPSGQIPWDWANLTYNTSITWDIIQANPDYDWDWRYVSSRKATPDIVSSNPDCPWDWNSMSSNLSLTWEFISSNLDKPWNWDRISSHGNITWDIIQANLDKPLCSCWSNKPECDILSHSSCRTQCNCPKETIAWDWDCMSYNPNITWNDIQANLDKPWNWHFLTLNHNITWDIIINNLEYPPRPDNKSNFSCDDCTSNKSNFSCDDCTSNKSNFSCDDWKNVNDSNLVGDWPIGKIPWNWDYISQHKNITFDIIQANPDKPWNWYYVIINPNITWNDIESIKLKCENLDVVSSNISQNPFTKQLDLIRRDCIIKWFAANRIRKWWLFKIYLNPFHRVGARRLERSYLEFALEDNIN